MKKKSLFILALVILSGSLCLLSAEFALRAYYTFKIDYNIEMWRYSKEISETVSDGRGHFQKAHRNATSMGVAVKTNSFGLRDREFSFTKARGTRRIAIIGDSFTFGWGVEQEQTFAKLLEKKLAHGKGQPLKNEVINFGIVNYNSAQEYALIQNVAEKFLPDLYIVCFYLNDAEPRQQFYKSFWSKHSMLIAFVMGRVRRIHSYFDDSRDFRSVYSIHYQGENWKKYKNVLNGIQRFTKGRLAVVLLPELRSLRKKKIDQIYGNLEKFWRQHGVPVLNLNSEFTSLDRKRFWVAADDPHPNALANRMIAKNIHDFLLEKELLK